MGFFDYIINGMGFETQNTSAPKPKKDKKKVKHTQQEGVASVGKYDELFMGSHIPATEATTASSFQYSATTENGTSLAKNVIIYTPTTQADLKNLIDFLRRKEPIIVNFGKIDDSIASSMLSFVSGALYALKGSIHPIANELFLLTPEGVNILVPREEQ